ncbi:Cytochrome P450, family 78, subfamily A, polypeptide 5 [Heracleum sosnowskyi]|uniref:Cytochrome P450, family 78, subfamily A, polypeptide 5 n=1 Tax=Heracleum sosnowskyi TaxID=360622 RepID=A0AAD8HSN0_9APIA|nr:Cytochrome P450, family 78, subfamily A, polypeptide 5 [Heracleum sosnowskyi]
MSSQNVIFLNSPNGFSSLFSNFELFITLITFLAVFCFWLSPGGLAWALSKAKTRSKSAISGPSGLPLLGLVFSFTTGLTHRVLAQFAQSFKASSLMAFSVGLTRFIISSQPDSAKEILNSSAFADRPIKESAYGLLFDRAMGFAPYMKKEIGSEMVCEIKNLMFKNGAVEVRKVVHFGSLNNVMKTVFGKKYKFGKNGDGVEFESLVTEGVKRGEGIEVGVDEGCGDFVDVLLDLEKDHKLTDSDMIAVLWEMIFRGTDTVAILLDWILARMVLHPEIQTKAQSEIDRVVGKNRTISDSDLQNLPYCCSKLEA